MLNAKPAHTKTNARHVPRLLITLTKLVVIVLNAQKYLIIVWSAIAPENARSASNIASLMSNTSANSAQTFFSIV